MGLTIDKLLAFTIKVRKQLIKVYYKDKVIKFYLNILELIYLLKFSAYYFCYSIGLFKDKLCLKNKFKVTTLLNIDTIIKILTKKLMKDAHLVIKQVAKLKLIIFTDFTSFLIGLYENMKILIKYLKIKYLIFITKAKDNNLVLN